MAVRIASNTEDTEYAKQMMAEAIDGGVIESNDDNAFFHLCHITHFGLLQIGVI